MATELQSRILLAAIAMSVLGVALRDLMAHEDHASSAGDRTFIELGDHEYRAEVVVKEAESLLVFTLFDKTGKQTVYSDASIAVINLKSGKNSKQYQLPAVTEKAGNRGNSVFQIQHKLLVSSLHRHDTKAVFRVSIQNRSYAGNISFAHHDH